MADQDRETERHYVEGAPLDVLIVTHQDHLLYHPPAHASEAEYRFGGFDNVLHQVYVWMIDTRGGSRGGGGEGPGLPPFSKIIGIDFYSGFIGNAQRWGVQLEILNKSRYRLL